MTSFFLISLIIIMKAACFGEPFRATVHLKELELQNLRGLSGKCETEVQRHLNVRSGRYSPVLCFVHTACGVIVHKSCKESVTACAKVKMKVSPVSLEHRLNFAKQTCAVCAHVPRSHMIWYVVSGSTQYQSQFLRWFSQV